VSAVSQPDSGPPKTGTEFVVVGGTDAREDPVRLLLVQGDSRPAVDATDEPMVMTFPHLLVRELIAFLGLSIVLVLLALLFDAPLEEIASPERTPNPAKAPWYFLGLQELLHYYPPVVAGVVLPALLIVALAVVPYFRINLERPGAWASSRGRTLIALWSVVGLLTLVLLFAAAHPVWPLVGPLWAVALLMSGGAIPVHRGRFRLWLATRSVPFWIFVWFLAAAVTLTIIGVFFRGPGWSFTLPWRDGIYY
jgi:hypothetical protein